jgi:hypothetical protein
MLKIEIGIGIKDIFANIAEYIANLYLVYKLDLFFENTFAL